MGTQKSHRDLDVWKLAVEFSIDVYKMTALFPQEEKYCLTRQIRRAVVSVASNIAEGSARNHSKELQQFLFHALGTVAEVETQLEIAYRLGYIKSYDHEMEKLTRIRKMLVGLIKAIRKRIADN